METNTITVSFKNVINRENSVVQYKILPAPGNDLYLESQGHQNYSWGVYLNLYDPQGNIILSETLVDARLSNPVKVEYGQVYTVEIDITLPKNISEGNYTVRFVIVSREYENENDANNYVNGTSGGASISESIASKQFITVIREPIKPKENTDIILYSLLTILLMGITLVLIGLIKLYKRHEHET